MRTYVLEFDANASIGDIKKKLFEIDGEQHFFFFLFLPSCLLPCQAFNLASSIHSFVFIPFDKKKNVSHNKKQVLTQNIKEQFLQEDNN